MTDELLRDAARAAGYKVVAVETSAFDDDVAIATIEIDGKRYSWAPRISDAVAFRLAVDLGLSVVVQRNLKGDPVAAAAGIGGDDFKRFSENFDDHPDKYAATRYAITRAAAEIGRQA